MKIVGYTILMMSILALTPFAAIFTVENGWAWYYVLCGLCFFILPISIYASYYLLRMIVHNDCKCNFSVPLFIIVSCVVSIFYVWYYTPDSWDSLDTSTSITLTIFNLIYSSIFYQQTHPTYESVIRVNTDDFLSGKKHTPQIGKKEKPQKPVSAYESIPKDSEGKTLWNQATPDVAAKAMLEQHEGDTTDALDTIDIIIEGAKGNVDKAERVTIKASSDPNDILMQRNKKKAAIEKAQKNLDFWKRVRSAFFSLCISNQILAEKRKSSETSKPVEIADTAGTGKGWEYHKEQYAQNRAAEEMKEIAVNAAVSEGKRLGTDIHVVNTPEELKNVLGDGYADMDADEVNAFTMPDGEIYIYAPNMTDSRFAIRQVWHEVVKNKGYKMILDAEDKLYALKIVLDQKFPSQEYYYN